VSLRFERSGRIEPLALMQVTGDAAVNPINVSSIDESNRGHALNQLTVCC
jgi:hypothetical protein